MSVKEKNQRTKPHSEFINLETYTNDSHLIFSKAEGGKLMVGRVYEMSPLAGGGSEFSAVIHNIAKSAPDDSTISVSLICHPDHEAESTIMKNKVHGGEVVQELFRRKVELVKAAMKHGWQADLPPINTRKVLISTSVPTRSFSKDSCEQALTFEQNFLNNLKSCGFADATPRSASELAGIYGQLSNIYMPRKEIELDPGLELKYQIFGPDNKWDFTKHPTVGQLADNLYVSCVTTKSYPRRAFHGLMNLVCGGPLNKGTALEGGGARILSPFILNTTIRIANQKAEWKRVDNAINSRQANQNLPIKLSNENSADKLADLELIKKQCSQEGNKFVYASTTMFLFGQEQDHAKDAASNFKNLMDKLGFDARVVRDNTLVRWVQNLPLNFSPKVAEKLKGETLMAASAAGTLLPVFGDYLGNVNKHFNDTGCPYFTRRGSLYYFDPFVSDTHFGGLLAAEPGAGKSFWLQDFIDGQLAMGRRVYLMDNGKSAKKHCLAIGGEYNEFGGDNNQFSPCLNPYSGLTDDDFEFQKEGITSLLLMMAFEGDTPDSGSRIAMSEASTAAWEKAGDKAEITHVVECLTSIVENNRESSKPDIVARAAVDLVPRLNAFIKNPKRGKYFVGEGTLSTEAQYCVFEIGTLGDDLHLKKCVLFFLMNTLLTRTKKLPGRKLMISDESHDLIEDEVTGHALEGIYLKSRKDGVSQWITIQSLLKLSETSAGSTILRQVAWKVIMQQPAEEIREVLKKRLISAFDEDPYFHNLVRDVQSKKGIYSECVIIGRKSYEVTRLYVDKWTATLFSSEGEARELILKWIDEGMPAIEAVNKFLNDKTSSMGKWVGDFINQLRKSYNLSDGEIEREIKEKLGA